MDGHAALIVSESQDVLQVDRGIYASERSPMGVGYRMIATSVGITADEKREIVRCAPSQGSLCATTEDAAALASFPLSSGRQALLLSRHAGIEPTARGGYNVLTHVLVLSPEAFACFDYDPFAVADAARGELGDEVPSSSIRRLETLPLAVPADEPSGVLCKSVTPHDAQQLVVALQALLQEQDTLLTGVALPEKVLRSIVHATPSVRRQGLSVSYGMKYTRARRFHFVVAEASSTEIKRVAGDGGVKLLAWETPGELSSHGYQVWLSFVQARCAQGRFDQVAELTRLLTEDASEAVLEQIVQIVQALEHTPEAEKSELEAYAGKYFGLIRPKAIPRNLLNEFEAAIKARHEAIEATEREAAEREAAEQAAAEADAEASDKEA